MVMFLSLIFVALFSSMAFAMLTMSSRNVHVADNHRDANRAFASALSGVEVMKYWMSEVEMPRSTKPGEFFTEMRTQLAQLAGDVAVGAVIHLCNSEGTSFSAQLERVEDRRFHIRVTGAATGLTRTVTVDYTFGVREESVFDFGVATKGPLQLSGNILLDGTNIAVEADVYIESESDDDVLSIIGNSQIAGDVKVTNPDGVVTLQGGQAGIGGETGQDAIDNHVTTGAPPTEFPVPNTSHFEQYLGGGDVITADTDMSNDSTYTNVRIAAGANPHFSGNTTINGVMFIETPNVVVFSGNCNITGLIVGDGDVNDDSGSNQLIFLGSVDSHSVSELPEESEFDGLREEVGTFVMAPGFRASFGGSFETLNGAIAANGIEFFGNAGGTIAGSVINYADTPMILSGNSDLFFNRSGITKAPAGFEQEIILRYDPSSYDEFEL
jgi:hypothetical protein